jgi:uncharacterized protein GlcG (DUF336 family)
LEDNVLITLSDVRRVIAAAEARARELGQPMNIAVVDAGGNLVSHVRMDGAWIGSIHISINKAFTARAFGSATRAMIGSLLDISGAALGALRDARRAVEQ